MENFRTDDEREKQLKKLADDGSDDDGSAGNGSVTDSGSKLNKFLDSVRPVIYGIRDKFLALDFKHRIILLVIIMIIVIVIGGMIAGRMFRHTDSKPLDAFAVEESVESVPEIVEVPETQYGPDSISSVYSDASGIADGFFDTDDERAYASQCIELNYDDVARYPGNWSGVRMKLTGTVIQSVEDDFGDAVYRVSDGNGDVWYVAYVIPDGGPRILTDDLITVYGECTGVQSYTNLAGAQTTIPGVKAEYIDIH